MKKSVLACCFALAVASVVNAETIVEQTVIIQIDDKSKGFNIITDKKAVETMIKEYPQGLEIGNVVHGIYCAKNHGAFTSFIPGKCENKAKH